ncbi:unnamed protein product [Phytophthora fragariaefolia]|uniref:Unnamed protein product n=1 Tax=Phytophthora fragariaefolia TaxID=1490495 RepID=A0A9W6XKC2_9STRA|nr:unnamed protein product [Phytophthora fragariaefolia]
MTTDSSCTGLPLRQLRWPTLPPVDLLEECRWLVTLDSRGVNPARKPPDVEGQARHKLDQASEMHTKELQHLCKQKSPYRQPLRRSKLPAPSPGSPAQRAAKSMLKLKEGLLRLDGTRWAQESLDEADGGLPPHQLIQQNPSRTSDLLSPRPIGSSAKPKSVARPSSTSPARVKTPHRSPNRTKKRPPTRDERDLAEKQKRLAVWLKANPDTNPENVVQGFRQTTIRDHVSAIPAYSSELESRIAAAMQCRGPLESGVRLWDDPVRSMLAAEMTSESVFGGVVPTRALAFEPPQSESFSFRPDTEDAKSSRSTLDDQTKDESTHGDIKTSDLARKVFDTAHRQRYQTTAPLSSSSSSTGEQIANPAATMAMVACSTKSSKVSPVLAQASDGNPASLQILAHALNASAKCSAQTTLLPHI